MTNNTTTPTEVEQADRDAAAELHLVVAGNRSPFDHRCAEAIRDGKNDHWPIVQAFARHRLNTRTPPVSMNAETVLTLVEQARFLSDRLDDLEWLEGDLESTLRDFMGHVDPAHARLRATLTAIRNLTREEQG